MIKLFNNPESTANMNFLWINLGKSDPTYVLPIVAGVTQFILSIMLSPATKTKDIVANDSKLKNIQDANKKEEDVAEMAVTMQQQMTFMMPVMTAVIALRLPAGLALYWIMGTIITIITQYFVSGWGGLARHWNRYLATSGPFKGKYLNVSNNKSLTKIPAKIHVKKNELFLKKGNNESLASVLKTLDGSDSPLKIKNKRATKIKKNTKQNRRKNKN
jgi:hypothetical protein